MTKKNTNKMEGERSKKMDIKVSVHKRLKAFTVDKEFKSLSDSVKYLLDNYKGT